MLVLVGVFALRTTLHFDEITRDIPLGERANLPDARHRVSIATVVSMMTAAIVLLQRFRILPFPPLWLVVLVSVPAVGFSLDYLFSLGALWT